MFCALHNEPVAVDGRAERLLTLAMQLLSKSVDYVNRFSTTGKLGILQIPQYRLTEAVELSERSVKFFVEHEALSPLTKRPVFPGCGIIAPCEGDLRTDNTLYEIKAVDRNFRSMDMRQLFVYCALNRAANLKPIYRIGLVNPLLGTYWVRDLDRVAYRVGGTLAAELLDDIIEFSLSPAGYVQS
jgi:hypothetical protein